MEVSMSLTIQSHIPFSAATRLEEGVKKSSTFYRVKNLLTGRVIENWREQLLSVVTVYYVIKAALSFFTGHFIVSLLEISTAGIAAVLRKEIKDFTNLHKATRSYQEQNMEFALSNLDLRKGIKEFQSEIQNLRTESERFQASNEEYAHNNAVHKSLLDTLERTTEELGTEIRDALQKGGQLSDRILEKFLEGVDRMKEEKQLLEGFTGDMREEHKEHLEQLDRVLSQVKDTGSRHIQMVCDANEEIRQSRETLQEIRGDLAHYKGQAEALNEEIQHLTQVRKGLQEDEQRIRATIGQLETVADRNVHSANMAAGVIKSLFYPSGENGESQFSLDRIFLMGVAGLVVTKIAKEVFAS